MNKETLSTKTLSKTTIFSVAIIILAGFLPFLHDFEFFKGKEGFSGFSSLRVGIWVVSMFVFALSGWVMAFHHARGKSYRFVMLAPITMGIGQLIIYVLDARKTQVNEFDSKVAVLFLIFMAMTIFYFDKTEKRK